MGPLPHGAVKGGTGRGAFCGSGLPLTPRCLCPPPRTPLALPPLEPGSSPCPPCLQVRSGRCGSQAPARDGRGCRAEAGHLQRPGHFRTGGAWGAGALGGVRCGVPGYGGVRLWVRGGLPGDQGVGSSCAPLLLRRLAALMGPPPFSSLLSPSGPLSPFTRPSPHSSSPLSLLTPRVELSGGREAQQARLPPPLCRRLGGKTDRHLNMHGHPQQAGAGRLPMRGCCLPRPCAQQVSALMGPVQATPANKQTRAERPTCFASGTLRAAGLEEGRCMRMLLLPGYSRFRLSPRPSDSMFLLF